jgi:hypothetical protein
VTQDQCRDVFLQQSITKNQGNHTRQTSKRQQQGKPFCTLTVTALGVHHSHTAGSNAEKEMSWRREEPTTTSQIGLAVGCTKGANPRQGSANCNIETEKIEMLLGKTSRWRRRHPARVEELGTQATALREMPTPTPDSSRNETGPAAAASPSSEDRRTSSGGTQEEDRLGRRL